MWKHLFQKGKEKQMQMVVRYCRLIVVLALRCATSLPNIMSEDGSQENVRHTVSLRFAVTGGTGA